MDYSIFLGPDRRHIPDGKWEEYKAQGKITLFDIVFRGLDRRDHWYKVTLTNGKEEFNLGQVFRESRVGISWAVIPNPSYCDKTIVDGIQIGVRDISQRGFATRLTAAEYLMRRLGFTDPKDW